MPCSYYLFRQRLTDAAKATRTVRLRAERFAPRTCSLPPAHRHKVKGGTPTNHPALKMRIVTWNCCRGDTDAKAKLLSWYAPDITLLQECSRQLSADTEACLWEGAAEKPGVAIVVGAGFTVTRGPRDPMISHSVFPFIVESAQSRLNVVAVWAMPEPNYVAAIQAGLDAYGDFIRSGSTIIAGDFNSGPTLKASGAAEAHAELCRRLGQDFGLASSFHAATGGVQAVEAGTYFHKRDKSRPYHIDYCFVPREWASRLLVRLGGVDEYTESDHRPIFVETLGT